MCVCVCVCPPQVGCVFNHKELYANKQVSDCVEGCEWTFGNDRAWKAMDTATLLALRHVDGTRVCVCVCVCECVCACVCVMLCVCVCVCV